MIKITEHLIKKEKNRVYLVCTWLLFGVIPIFKKEKALNKKGQQLYGLMAKTVLW